jgi:hypothetical protein
MCPELSKLSFDGLIHDAETSHAAYLLHLPALQPRLRLLTLLPSRFATSAQKLLRPLGLRVVVLGEVDD